MEPDADVGIEVDGEPEEARAGVARRVPRQPSAAERQQHFDEGHAVYRQWCPHCVQARATGSQHRPKPDPDEDESPATPHWPLTTATWALRM
eukprot:6455494-Amphidinium_carterae.2